jgi:UPF0176 protein
MFKIAALYKFFSISKPELLQDKIRDHFKQLKIKGTILVGHEGINGTISGNDLSIDAAIDFLKKINGCSKLDVKYSESDKDPFIRLKIKLKQEIVTIGDTSIDPNKIVGNYVSPDEWNLLIQDEDTIVIDTRNDYEYSIGTFKNAINPNTQKFREFPSWVEKNNFSDEDKKSKRVAMFCTGGIRCEKASSFMKDYGFDEVFHLKGGILKYLEEMPQENSLWEGECFVFDDRVSVNHNLEPGSYDMCHGCRMPITDQDKDSSKYIKGVACPNCFDKTTEEQKARYMSRQKQVDLAKSRNQKHIGPKEEICLSK